MRRLAACALVLAAGCSGSSGPGPRALSPAPSPPVSSPSPSPIGTAEQQVLAAVRAYYEAANRATQTGDVSEMRARVVPNCNCNKLAESISKTYAAGSRFLGARDTITSLRVVTIEPPAATVAIRIHIGAYVLVKPDGTRKAYAADNFSGAVVLLRRADNWLLASVRGI